MYAGEQSMGGWATAASEPRRELATLGAADLAAADDPPRRRGRRPPAMSAAQILAAIRRWHEIYGEPPTMADWDPYRARQIDQAWRIARYDQGEWPSVKTVRNHFGRLSDAVAAAGLVPRQQGQHQPRTDAALDPDVLLHMATLRTQQDRRPTPHVLADQVREVVRAQGSTDPDDLKQALIELAATALRWADASA